MIPVLSVAQMRAVDTESIDGNLSVGYGYMERAGQGVYRAILDIMPDASSGEIAVICGKGNNGGDGYVVARLLMGAGYRVTCFSLCDPQQLVKEARRALEDFWSAGGVVQTAFDPSAFLTIGSFSLIVDGILGTGMRGSPHGSVAETIRIVNSSSVPIIAIDTPSGLDNDTGAPGDPCVKASLTVTLGFPKIGSYFYPGRTHVGGLVVEQLGYPQEIVERNSGRIVIPEVDDFKTMLPPRIPDGSKFDHGLVLLVSGSRGMTGAPTLAAQAALRSGCGMVHLAAPESIVPILAIKLTESVLHPVPETVQGSIDASSAQMLLEMAERMHCVLIGPGLSHHGQTTEAVRHLLSELRSPVILDADGLNAFRDRADDLKNRTCQLVITPHRGEWARLFGPLPQVPIDLVTRLREVAQEFRMTILLKGNPTVIADAVGDVFIMPFGNSGLATAGTGDVLCGIIAGLAAQGCSLRDATILGCYLHATSGALASDDITEYATIASDVIDYLPHAFRDLLPH